MHALQQQLESQVEAAEGAQARQLEAAGEQQLALEQRDSALRQLAEAEGQLQDARTQQGALQQRFAHAQQQFADVLAKAQAMAAEAQVWKRISVGVPLADLQSVLCSHCWAACVTWPCKVSRALLLQAAGGQPWAYSSCMMGSPCACSSARGQPCLQSGQPPTGVCTV